MVNTGAGCCSQHGVKGEASMPCFRDHRSIWKSEGCVNVVLCIRDTKSGYHDNTRALKFVREMIPLSKLGSFHDGNLMYFLKDTNL